MKKIIFLLIIIYICIAQANAQSGCYERLYDPSGLNTDSYQAALTAKACQLKDSFPNLDQQANFKVYDFGFYLLNDITIGLKNVFDAKVAELNGIKPYNVIFGKQNDAQGLYTRIWVNLSFPEDGYFSCMNFISENYEEALERKMELVANQVQEDNGGGLIGYAAAEKAVMDSLIVFFGSIKSCCLPNKGASCENCVLNANDIQTIVKDALTASKFSVSEIFTENNCTATIKPNFSTPVASLINASNLLLTINSPTLGTVTNLDLDEFALCKVQEYNDQSMSARAYIVGLTDCYNLLPRVTAFLNDQSQAKFLFVVVPAGGDKVKLLYCSMVNGVTSLKVNLAEDCVGDKSNIAAVAVEDFLNYFYFASFSNNGTVIQPHPKFNSQARTKMQSFFPWKKNSAATTPAPQDTMKATDDVWVNPYSRIKVFWLQYDSETKLWGNLPYQKVELIITKNNNQTEILEYTTLGPTDAIDGIYDKLGDGINIVKVKFSYNSLSVERTIKLRKINPQPYLLVATHDVIEEFHYNAYCSSIGLLPVRDSLLSDLRYINRSGNLDFNVIVSEHIAGIGYSKSWFLTSYLVVPARDKFIKVSTFFYNKEMRVMTLGGIRKRYGVQVIDETDKYFEARWTDGAQTDVNSLILPDANITEIPLNSSKIFSVAVNRKGEQEMIFSTSVDITAGAPSFPVSFQVGKKRVQADQVYVLKTDPDGNTLVYSSMLNISGSPKTNCEMPYVNGNCVRIQSFVNNTLKNCDWAIEGEEVTIFSNLINNTNTIEFRINELNKKLITIRVREVGSQIILGTLLINVVSPNPAPSSIFTLPPGPSSIRTLQFNDSELVGLTAPYINTAGLIQQNLRSDLTAWHSQSVMSLTNPIIMAEPNAAIQVEMKMLSHNQMINNHKLSDVNGFTINGFTTPNNENLFLRNVEFDGNIVRDAELIVRMSDEQEKCIFNPIYRLPNEIARSYAMDSLYNNGSQTDSDFYNELQDLFISHATPSLLFRDSVEVLYRMLKNSINDYARYHQYKFTSTIYFDLENLHQGAQNKNLSVNQYFMRTVRHEVGHAIFPVLYPYEAIKWKIIGNLFHSVDRPYFFQSRSLGDASPHNTCSGGLGHEKYNPEDAFSCGMGSGN